jgi:tRNA (Thr-GGU) A37 N-methylase
MFEKLRTDGGEFVQPIGRIHSCFKKCLGTPRQGYFAPSSRGFIEFLRNISPDTLIGLEDFSHVWIIFIFHQNTNGNNSRAFSGLMSDSHRHTFKVRVQIIQ